jgi:hypothetical protein
MDDAHEPMEAREATGRAFSRSQTETGEPERGRKKETPTKN